MSLTILFLYIHIFNQCVVSKETFFISEKLDEKHIMEDARPVKEIPYGDILSRFNEAQQTPGFASTNRSIHSFLVTSNRTTTIKDLKREYKEAIRSHHEGKNYVNSADLNPTPVAVINLKIMRPMENKLYNVINCMFSNEATFKLGASTRMIGGNEKRYDINHLYKAQLTSAKKCLDFIPMRHPSKTCTNYREKS